MAADDELQASQGSGASTPEDSVSFVSGNWLWSPGDSTERLRSSVEDGAGVPGLRLVGGLTSRGPLGVVTAFVFTPLSLAVLVVTQFFADTAEQLGELVGGYFDGLAALLSLTFLGQTGTWEVTTPGLTGVATSAFEATALAVSTPAYGFVLAVVLTLTLGFIGNVVIQYVR